MQQEAEREPLADEYRAERRRAIRDAGLILLIPVAIAALWLAFMYAWLVLDGGWSFPID